MHQITCPREKSVSIINVENHLGTTQPFLIFGEFTGNTHSQTVGGCLVSNQANSFWRKSLIMENEEKPLVLSFSDFQRNFSDIWGNLGGNSGFIKYHMKALIAVSRDLNFLLPPPKPKLSFLFLMISQDFDFNVLSTDCFLPSL